MIDLDNLKKEDFIEMARYVHSMEVTLERAKAEMLALVVQRDNLQAKVNKYEAMLITPISNVPKKAKLTDDLDLVNPEQYKEKKQF